MKRYKQHYLLVALAVMLANTVITGSLLVGDSVRHTLVKRVDERLGRTVSLITSGHGFMNEAIAERLSVENGATASVLFTDGFIPDGTALLPVSVWGIDSCMAAIASAGFVVPKRGETVLNSKTANELQLKVGDDIVVRLPNTRMIPSGSLFVTDNYTVSLRLRIVAIIGSSESGNLNLRNEQQQPFNVFINRAELTVEMEMNGKCNLVMCNSPITDEELANAWTPDISGITATFHAPPKLPDGTGKWFGVTGWEIVSERVFIENDIITSIDEHFPKANHLFSYLVNDISLKNRKETSILKSIPYSFVTAIDSFLHSRLTANDMILTDYAARRLNASIGDTVVLTFFVSNELKELTEEKHDFIVRKIIPLLTLWVEGRLSADFPGLSSVENCTDWDSDLPIDMARITKEDEDYWDMYHSTPKALIAWPTGADLWKNSYGSATAVRIAEDMNVALDEILTPADAGIMLSEPRIAGLEAARSGVDFKSLFLALAFFVITAALLLTIVPIYSMLRNRRCELQLMQAIGYQRHYIRRMIINELTITVVCATLVGALTAILYNRLVLFALGNVWNGAVHTENFAINVKMTSLLPGSIASLLICFFAIALPLRNREKKRKKDEREEAVAPFSIRTTPASHKNIPYISNIFKICIVLMVILLAANIMTGQSPLLFMITGIVGLVAVVTGYGVLVKRLADSHKFNRNTVIYKNLHHQRHSGILSVAALATGLFVVFAVGLRRTDFSNLSGLEAGTGGFSFWGEHTVPLYHSLSSSEGRARLGLSALPNCVAIQQLYRHGGDDASCLNLNRAPQPTVLGVDAALLADASFTFATTDTSIKHLPENHEIWAALRQKQGDYYPVIADQTVLQWGLMKNVGDTIVYRNRRGEQIVFQFVGGLNTSIFQGNLLIDKQFFAEIWGLDGSEIMLVQAPDSIHLSAKQLLTQALANYGLRLDFCNERLKEFNSVTDTYLTVFLMLGGVGLLIGLFGMLLIIKRGLLSRAKETSMLLAIGFEADAIKKQLFRESMAVPLFAISAGTVTSLISAASVIPSAGVFTWATMLFIVALLILVALSTTRKHVNAHMIINDHATD